MSSKIKKFSEIRKQFSMLWAKLSEEDALVYRFYLVAKGREKKYIDKPELLTVDIEAINFFVVDVQKYESNLDSYSSKIDKAFDDCIVKCMGQYGLNQSEVNFQE